LEIVSEVRSQKSKRQNERNQTMKKNGATVNTETKDVATMTIEELRAELARLSAEQEILSAGNTSGGRKAQVLAILADGKEHTVKNLAKVLGIEPTNVSSQLSYLKKDGWAITSGMTKSHKKVLLNGAGKPRNLKEERRVLEARLKEVQK